MSKFKKIVLIWTILTTFIIAGGCLKQDNDALNNNLNNQNVINDESNTGKDADTEQNKSEDKKDSKDTDTKTSENSSGESGIKEVYGQYDIKAGTCINEMVINIYSNTILENFNSVTMENDMKPENILNKSKSIAAGDIVVDYPQTTINELEWAKKNNLMVRGHCLVWYSQTPDWIFYKDFDTSKGLVDRDTMLARMESYIRQNFEILDTLGYSDIIYAYDVVNEAILDDGSLRDCLWKQTIGDDYIWYAFYYADKYAPDHIKLYYNDYNEQFKAESIVKLAKSLVDEDGRSLIDGIGCQAHLYTNDSVDTYIDALKTLSTTGLDIQMTEMDVGLGSWQNILEATEENLKTQGKFYYDLISRVIEGKEAGTINISAITFWGVSDAVSWRRDRSPLLFDANLEPKYAYYGATLDHDKAGY